MFQGFQADDDLAFPLHLRIALDGGDARAFQFQALCAVIGSDSEGCRTGVAGG
jgi:hypothetical protein